MDNIVRNFIVGSSLPAVIISLGYIGRAYNNTPSDQHPFPFTYIAWILPFIFGLVNVIVDGKNASRLTMIIIGILFGIVLSNVGTRIYSMPEKIFGFSKEDNYIPLFIAPILYSFIWGVIIYWINQNLIY